MAARPPFVELLEEIASCGNDAVRRWLDDWYELERAQEALRIMAERIHTPSDDRVTH